MGNWANGIKLPLTKRKHTHFLQSQQLAVGFGEMSVEGPRLFEEVDDHLPEKQAAG